MARINLSFRWSALALFKDKTAQIAAGSQPINVIWRIRQTIPVIIFPRTIKERKGRRIANNMVSDFNIMNTKVSYIFKNRAGFYLKSIELIKEVKI
ncbi:hypothetical protein AOB46_20520 [Chryseobacterium indologenes]|uniref:Uncharacterized protein n=1 Tax=Chryseobacterium indologenes TaxID=253 RepID=A0A0N0ZUP9_CHRID|nr:hypothetical protein AOB46_20520 [Chryseobacterium indologenes]